MASLKFWLWLSSCDLSPRKREAALNHFGTIESLYYAESGDYKEIPELQAADVDALSDKSFVNAERILEQCDLEGVKVLTMQDARFPDRLKNIDAPPVVLYYKGRMPAFDEEIALAVIGSRTPSAYGLTVCERISFDIAHMGGYVVSGMAAGLDAAAHRGALKANRPTAAILGSGVDVVYPPENRELYEDIVSAGVVISEYPPGTRPLGTHFPARNRIISGLSLGVLVVEAGKKSGTLITANHASEQGRDLFAIPGPINAPMSEGTNALIRDGYAKLSATAWDVVSEYAAVYPHKIIDRPVTFNVPATTAKKSVKTTETVNIEVSEVKKLDEVKIKSFTDVVRDIIVSIADAPLYIDDIADAVGVPAARILSELTLMEIEGLVKELSGRRYAVGDSLYI